MGSKVKGEAGIFLFSDRVSIIGRQIYGGAHIILYPPLLSGSVKGKETEAPQAPVSVPGITLQR